MKKAPKGTTRGVFVVDKAGKVLAAEPGGPAATVEVVKKLVGEKAAAPAAETVAKSDEPATETAEANGSTNEDVEKANVAADVADTAEKIDSNDAKAKI